MDINLGFTSFMATSLATIAATNLVINRYSERIESFLETHKSSRSKSATRSLYNWNQKLNSILTICYNALFRKNSPIRGELGGYVDHMILYPIKSTSKGLKVTQWEIDQYGLKHDRQYIFAVFDEEKKAYKIRTLKDNPRLSTVEVSYQKDANLFTFDYPKLDGSIGQFSLPCVVSEEFVNKHSTLGTERRKLSVWSNELEGWVLDQVLDPEFLAAMELPEKTVLLYSPDGKVCSIGAPKDVQRRTLFHDYFPLLMCSVESYEYVKSTVAGKGGEHARMETFRPNVIIREVGKPFAEDFYYKFDILTHFDSQRRNFTGAMKCVRCATLNIDNSTGTVDKKSVVYKTLSKYRRVDEANPYSACFGMYVINHQDHFVLSAGDEIDLLLRRSTKMEEDPF